MNETLENDRAILVAADRGSYNSADFPGSAAWIKHRRDTKALRAFDDLHPEIIAEIRAAKTIAEKARYNALSDFVKAGS